MTRNQLRIPPAAHMLAGALALACCGCQQQAATNSAAASQTPATDDKPAAASVTTTDANSKEPALIPRSVLFGNPQRAGGRISPDGKWLSYLAPVDGILNVFVAPVDDFQHAEQVTHDKTRDIRSYNWAENSAYILYTQDTGGDEDWHVYATEVATKKTTDLTPLKKIHATIEGTSDRFPDDILVGLNDRIPQLHDIYRVNVKTGEKQLVQENAGVAGYVTDDDFKVRFAFNYTPEGGTELLKPKDPDAAPGDKGIADWEDFIKVGPEDAMTTSPAGFNKAGDVLYMLDSRDRDTGALYALDLKTGDKKLLAENAKADVGEVISHPTEKTIQAVGFTYARREWQVLDPSIQADLDYLAKVEDGELIITSRTLDDKLWTVAYLLDDGPAKTYLYDRSDKNNLKTQFLFTNRDDLAGYPLVKMHTPLVKTRDGLELVCYLSLPKNSDPDGDGKPDKPLPMVLDVHGGPWARDEWGFNPYHQWLANRGYAVLNVNYRGSTGFGKNVRQRRQRRVVPQNARRPARRRRLGRRQRHRPARQGLHHGRQLRRLRHARGHDLHARRVRLRRRHRRPVQPGDAAEKHPAVLDAVHARHEEFASATSTPTKAAPSSSSARRWS